MTLHFGLWAKSRNHVFLYNSQTKTAAMQIAAVFVFLIPVINTGVTRPVLYISPPRGLVCHGYNHKSSETKS